MRLFSASGHEPFCRLYTPSTNLVLDGCSADVLIADVHASVTLSQRFTNPTKFALNATYAFGLMAGAAVCGFEMVRKDGTKVEGIVKASDEATSEYRQAIQEGKTASLGQEESHDVFSISVGNIHPSETVTINLRFIQALTDDESHDEVKFIFPGKYAQRYGAPPSFIASLTSTIQPFQMKVTVQQAGPIKSISCPSGHSISFSVDSANPTCATVSLKGTRGYLVKDVILVVSAANLDSPRCFIEEHPSGEHTTTAMALTLVPRFELSDIEHGMEYIFMIDRSGSMEGSNIRLVKDALVVLLRGLPTKDTTFNLVSFGSRTTLLWKHSKVYSQAAVDEATRHIDGLSANYGGTEIASALNTVFYSLPKPLVRPAAIFLLTDGSSWDVDACVSNTTSAVRNLPSSLPWNKDVKSFIRVFTVGIGAGASSNMCDSIARAGGGTSVYVQEGEDMVGKCARLVRAARTPKIDVEIKWVEGEGASELYYKKDKLKDEEKYDEDKTEDNGDDTQTLLGNEGHIVGAPPVNLFNTAQGDLSKGTGPPKHPVLTPPADIQQAPLVIPTMFSGTRTCVYAILENCILNSAGGAPMFIKVLGKVEATGTPVELVVPVTRLVHRPLSSPRDQASRTPFLHTLAAKSLIMDRQDDIYPSLIENSHVFKFDAELRRSYLKTDIIRLGTTYGLASQHTSFIAVDHTRSLFSVSRTAKRKENENQAIYSYNGYSSPPGQMYGGAGSSSRAQAFVDYYDPTLDSVDSNMIHGQEEYSSSRAGTRYDNYDPTIEDSIRGEQYLALSEISPVPLRSCALADSAPIDSAPAPKKKGSARFGKLRSTDNGGSMAPTKGRSSPSLLRRMSLSLSLGSPKTHHSRSSSSSQAISSVTSERMKSPSVTINPTVAFANTTSFSKANVTAALTLGQQLAAVARLQHFDGKFSWEDNLFVVLNISLGDAITVKQRLNDEGILPDLAATVLAWAWLEQNGGDQGSDMAKKAEEQIGIQLGAKNTKKDKETLKQKVLAIIPLS